MQETGLISHHPGQGATHPLKSNSSNPLMIWGAVETRSPTGSADGYPLRILNPQCPLFRHVVVLRRSGICWSPPPFRLSGLSDSLSPRVGLTMSCHRAEWGSCLLPLLWMLEWAHQGSAE